METPTPSLAARLGDVSATFSQAEAVLELISEHPTNPHALSAIFGALTIISAARDVLGEIEIEARRGERVAL